MNKGWYKKDGYFKLWCHLIMKATHQGMEFWFNKQNIKLNPGQFITGRKKLSEETGIHASKVERILTYFEKIEQQIEQQKTPRNRLITIVNFASYQKPEQHNEQPVNNQRTTNEQPVNTYNNDNNDNNDKFNIFWDRYHLITKLGKTDKLPTEKYWKRLSNKEKELAINNIQSYFNSLSNSKFCKKARTYLGDKSFNDEYNENKINNEELSLEDRSRQVPDPRAG